MRQVTNKTRVNVICHLIILNYYFLNCIIIIIIIIIVTVKNSFFGFCHHYMFILNPI